MGKTSRCSWTAGAVIAAALGLCVLPAEVARAQGGDGERGGDGSPATAEAASGGADDEGRAGLERAKEHMERGQELYIQSRFLEAAEEFKRAYEAQAFSAFLYNAAIAYEKAGEDDEALAFYAQYLDREPGASDASEVRSKVRELRASLREAEATAAAATPETGESAEGATGATAPGTAASGGTGAAAAEPEGRSRPAARGRAEDMKSLLSIRTNPEGAQVTLKQTSQVVASGAAPFAHTLDEGRFKVTVEHPDFRTVEDTIRIRPGRVYVIIVEMSQGQFLGYRQITTTPPGASVYVDDREIGAYGVTPVGLQLPTGGHHLWIEKPGYETIEQDIELEIGGDDPPLVIDLERVSYGRLRVVSNVRGARVLVDGEQVGVTPFQGDVDAGVRKVKIEADGMKAWEEEVDIQRGQETPVRVRLRPAPSRGGAWATAVVAAAFVGGGIALGLLANDRENELDGALDRGLLANDDGRITEGRFFAIGANAAYGVGAVLGILSIYYFVKDDLPDSEGVQLEPRDWALFPTVDPVAGGGGATLRVSF